MRETEEILTYHIPPTIPDPKPLADELKELETKGILKLEEEWLEAPENERPELVREFMLEAREKYENLYLHVHLINIISPGYVKNNFPDFYYSFDSWGNCKYQVLGEVEKELEKKVKKRLGRGVNRITKGRDKAKVMRELGRLGIEREDEKIPWDLLIPLNLPNLTKEEVGDWIRKTHYYTPTPQDIINAYLELNLRKRVTDRSLMVNDYFERIGEVEEELKKHITSLTTPTIRTIISTLRKD